VAASFHLPSVNTANIDPKPYQQYEIPTIPAVVISKVLLPQSNVMAAFVHSHSSLFPDVSPGLPKYSNHVTNIQFYSVRPLAADPLRLLLKISNC
jgi:hypothetical protein